MVKPTKSNVGKSSFKKFMKSSQISPHFINNDLDLDLDLDYEPNYGKSLESHASHAVNITPNVNENIESGSGSGSDESDESDHSNATLDSNNESDNNDNNDDNDVNDDSYSSITKTKDLKIFKMKNLLAQKRSTLLYKEQEIKELGKQNSFLETVIRDYEKYNTTILEEKQKQKKALKILSQHIREISKNNNNNNNNNKNDSYLSRVKNDQTLLLDEIEKIRDEIAHVLNSRGVEYQSSDGDGDADVDEYNDDNDNDCNDNDDNDNDDYRGMY